MGDVCWVKKNDVVQRSFFREMVSIMELDNKQLGEFVERKIKKGAFIQGGSHRVDTGPTLTETNCFKFAVKFHKICEKKKLGTKLVCMVNDFGLIPEERPKNLNKKTVLPKEYLEVLKKNKLSEKDVLILYESYLRNKAMRDDRIHHELGIKVVKCPSIMARFYKILEEKGSPQLIIFWVVGECGPKAGLDSVSSGYKIDSMEVLNYAITENGKLLVAAHYDPKKENCENVCQS